MGTLGESVRNKREKIGWTQSKLSMVSKVSRSYIVEIEKDIHNNISIAVLCDLCKALECTPNDIIPEEYYKN